MRACEYVKTPKPGRTKIARLRCIVFRDRNRKIIPHGQPNLLQKALYVTVIFEDQKNKQKNDVRTQRRTKHKFLCPVKRLGKAIQRILKYVPNASPDTPLCTVNIPGKSLIDSAHTLKLLRFTCKTGGGKDVFGFHPEDIGNKSMRSGAAMALFLNKHSTPRIMLLGRWLSDAFLVYIRPQVLEWTNNMSSDMININDFIDIGLCDRASPSDPRLQQNPKSKNGLSSRMTMPTMNNMDF